MDNPQVRLTVHGRWVLVRRVTKDGMRVEEAAQAMGVSARTACKSLKRHERKRARPDSRPVVARPFLSAHSPDSVADRTVGLRRESA